MKPPKNWKEKSVMRQDQTYRKMALEWMNEKDPQRKDQIAKEMVQYKEKRLKKLGFLTEEEKLKKQEEGKKQREISRQKHLQLIKEQIAKGIPAKHVIRCDYPGIQFREVIDASKIKSSYEKDYDSYQESLYDNINDRLSGLVDFEKFLDMDGYFTEDNIPACGYFLYDEVRSTLFGDKGLFFDENIKIYLDNLRNDGTIIETKELEIEDCFDLEREEETLMECGFGDAMDKYITVSLKRFVEESRWNFALRKGSRVFIRDIKKWPLPKEDGSWLDKDGTEMKPYIWFGKGDPDTDNELWNLYPKMKEYYLGFWFSKYPLDYIVEYNYSGFEGSYVGSTPDIKGIRKHCPILLEENDTLESIEEKIQAFFIKLYREAH